MRRKDREITEKSIIDDFIKNEQILRIAFNDDGDIYIVPVNYGYKSQKDICFYFHGAKGGRKYELAKSKPVVGFEIDGKYELLSGGEACEFSANYQSIIGTGVLSLVDDVSEKRMGLNAVMYQTTNKSDWDYSKEMLEKVAVFKLEVKK